MKRQDTKRMSMGERRLWRAWLPTALAGALITLTSYAFTTASNGLTLTGMTIGVTGIMLMVREISKEETK